MVPPNSVSQIHANLMPRRFGVCIVSRRPSDRSNFAALCDAHELVQTEDGRWYLTYEGGDPEGRIFFETTAIMLEWAGTMLDNEEGPWRLGIRREDGRARLSSSDGSAKEQLRKLNP